GADARIVLDIAPEYAARAKASFVAPEAQFTPKQVETRSERDKLMFRIKLSVPPEVILPYIERVKTGIRGVGYVRLDDAVAWPAGAWAGRAHPAPRGGRPRRGGGGPPPAERPRWGGAPGPPRRRRPHRPSRRRRRRPPLRRPAKPCPSRDSRTRWPLPAGPP